MQLTTAIDIPKSNFRINPDSKVILLGSCFADNIGDKFIKAGFDAIVNPFGTLYNPMSIASVILRCADNGDNMYNSFSPEIFMSEDGMWHSWLHHSKFSASTQEELLHRINTETSHTSEFIRNADVLIITLGTSVIYRLRENGMLVANCHKQKDSMFIRERLTVDSIVDKWKEVVEKLLHINNKLKIMFTVSPIRHKRDGMHVNNISKGILLQAVDELVDYPQLQYFPSYEIMLDELRDYRFYAEDMIHPSPLAVEYIWQRFQNTYFDLRTQEHVRMKNKEWARSQHREIIKIK